jgi:hypothetical protein
MNPSTKQRPGPGRSLWPGLLTRGPRAISAPGTRAVVTILILVGAALTVVAGIIHLYLWGEANGYSQIPTIGPLFLAQGIGAIVVGVATAAVRWLAAALAAAGLLISTAAGLLLSIEVGLFNFRESWAAPYVTSSFYEEIAGAVLLLVAVWFLARAGRSGGGKHEPSHPA